MMYAKAPHRLGTTAIAAVIALTATPVFAQSIEAAPAVVTPPPVVTPAPVAQAAAPDSTNPGSTNSVVTAPVVAGPATGSNLAQTPRIDLGDTPDTTPVVAKSDSAPAPRATRSATLRVSSPVVKDAPTSKPAALPAPVAAVATPPLAAVVAKPAAPPAQPAAAPAQRDETLPIAGLAGLGALALIGGALAMRGRKREDEVTVYEETEIVPEPMVAAPVATAPVYARDLRDMPARETVDGPATTLPSGFDISRFGPHVQAAYRGPTEDNPSLSLKTRLKRASFFDQRERMAAAPQQNPSAPSVVATTMDRVQPVATRRPEPAPSRPVRQPNFRPAFQS